MTHQLAEILAAPDLTPAKKLILWYVGTCPTVPKRREIAAALGLSIHTVDRYVTQLRRAGLWPVPGTYVPEASTTVPVQPASTGTTVPADLESRLARLETLAARQAKWNRGAAKRIEALQRSGTSVPVTPEKESEDAGTRVPVTRTTVPVRVEEPGTHVPDDDDVDDAWDDFEVLSIVCKLLDDRGVPLPSDTIQLTRYIDRAHARRPDLDPVEVAERVAAYLEKRFTEALSLSGGRVKRTARRETPGGSDPQSSRTQATTNHAASRRPSRARVGANPRKAAIARRVSGIVLTSSGRLGLVAVG